MTLQQVSLVREGQVESCSKGQQTGGRICSRWASRGRSGRPSWRWSRICRTGQTAIAWVSPWSWSRTPCISRWDCLYCSPWHGVTCCFTGFTVIIRHSARPCSCCRAQRVTLRAALCQITEYNIPEHFVVMGFADAII